MDQNGMTNDSIAQKSRLVWTKYTSKNVFCYSHDVYPMSNSFMTVEYLDSWKTQLWRNFEESDHSVDQMEQAGLVGLCEGGGSQLLQPLKQMASFLSETAWGSEVFCYPLHFARCIRFDGRRYLLHP